MEGYICNIKIRSNPIAEEFIDNFKGMSLGTIENIFRDSAKNYFRFKVFADSDIRFMQLYDRYLKEFYVSEVSDSHEFFEPYYRSLKFYRELLRDKNCSESTFHSTCSDLFKDKYKNIFTSLKIRKNNAYGKVLTPRKGKYKKCPNKSPFISMT